ncbi:MAG: DNA replication/repair protein RecF [Ruminococcaceae bacterium]|nr:DNA replication/repair protein RecF [Oscillospiraceae bacterium]MBQ2916517.1 DNA replication/repair protein RecF [Clostridia bacterium]
MILKSIALRDYRNFTSEKVEFCEGSNIISGKNAQGKTNLMESVWLFTSGRSFRTPNEKEFIRNGCDSASVTGVFSRNGRDYEAELRFFDTKTKQIHINGIKVKQGEMLGKFPAVLFFPEQLSLIKSGPDVRRKFLDMSISQIKPRYYEVLSEYNRVLAQKNHLLKNADGANIDTLEIWNARQAKLSSIISNTRRTYCEKLTGNALKYLAEISGDTETLTAEYTVSGETNDEYELFEKICKLKSEEIHSGYSQIGAHKDDFDLFINGNSSRRFASQGQQRSIVLCLKLAEADMIEEAHGEYPLLLFDDVLSELDEQRKDFITNRIKGKQVIITSCDVPDGVGDKVMRVENGKIIK